MTFPLKIVGLLKTKVDTTAQFKITINTALGTGNNFQLPLPSGQTYNFVVYWGDGNFDTITAYNQAETLHSYSSGGVYQITIDGKCGGWSFDNGVDKLKITYVNQWGNVGLDFFSYAFYGCSNLTSIASDGIKSSSILSMSRAFRETSITSIPSGLFDNVSDISDCVETFYSCPITSIPSGLFDNAPSINSFSSCFYSTNITSIPTDLFRYNTSVTSFVNCFVFTNITSIPTDLFRYNTLVVNFQGVFQLCYYLTSIPENLFYYNTLVTNYSYAFYYCRNITLPSIIFNTSNLSIVTNFNYYMAAASTSYSNTGTTQDIWNYATSATSLNAFINQTSITNYASIPNGWKGL